MAIGGLRAERVCADSVQDVSHCGETMFRKCTYNGI